jgi:hypothetical protein
MIVLCVTNSLIIWMWCMCHVGRSFIWRQDPKPRVWGAAVGFGRGNDIQTFEPLCDSQMVDWYSNDKNIFAHNRQITCLNIWTFERLNIWRHEPRVWGAAVGFRRGGYSFEYLIIWTFWNIRTIDARRINPSDTYITCLNIRIFEYVKAWTSCMGSCCGTRARWV